MSDLPGAGDYDPEAMKAKYLAERDKRLIPGRADIRDLSRDEHFARYREDPFTPVTDRPPVTDDVDVVIFTLLKRRAITGMEQLDGRSFHTARWDYALTGGGPGEPLTKLGDKVVGLIGTGATGIQCLPPLADAAKHVYVFQRTPSAIGVRGNRPTAAEFAGARHPGWQQDRMDNFQGIML